MYVLAHRTAVDAVSKLEWSRSGYFVAEVLDEKLLAGYNIYVKY